MPNLEYRLVFDAHDRASVKHVMAVNGAHIALCRDPLVPWSHQRFSDGRSRMESEATCPDCIAVLADRIATLAHHGQIDRDGKPHLDHVNEVVRLVVPLVPTLGWQVVIVAKLHDVVEDSPITESGLREYFFSRDVVEAVWMLSRNTVPDGHTYLGRIGSETAGDAGRWARAVKFADATHNWRRSKPKSIGPPTPREEQDIAKYQRIREEVVAAMNVYGEVTLQFREQVYAERFTQDVTRVPGHILNEA